MAPSPDQLTARALELGIRAKRQGLTIEVNAKGQFRAVAVSLKTRWVTFEYMDRWLTVLWENRE